MKRVKFTAAVLVLSMLLITLAGCVPNIPKSGWEDHGRAKLKGKGKVITQTVSVEDYQKVKIDANLQVIYTAEESDVVEITGYENLLEALEVTVKDGTLILHSDREFAMGDGNKTAPKVKISSPELTNISVEGAVLWKEGDPLVGETLKLEVQGVCDLDTSVDVKELVVDLAGVGEIILQGQAEKAEITSSGVGDVKALALEVAEMQVELSGVGNVEVYCTEQLDVLLNGMGNVTYSGDAQVNKQIVGAGIVQKKDF